MKQVESWQILSIAATILATAIALVIAFRDSIPAWLYLASLILFGLLLAGCFVWLIAITNPPQYVITHTRKALQSRYKRKYQEHLWQRRLRLIEEWADKWRVLGDLIVKVMECNDEPTQTQEEQFTALREWFNNNRPEVLPAWMNFVRGRTDMAYDRRIEEASFSHILHNHWDDPFSAFYQPVSLRGLAILLDVVPSPTTWTPSEDEVCNVRILVHILTDRVNEFVTWYNRSR